MKTAEEYFNEDYSNDKLEDLKKIYIIDAIRFAKSYSEYCVRFRLDEDNYYYLKDGDTVKEGCEYFCDDSKGWMKITMCEGYTHNSETMYKTRRLKQ